MSAMIGRPRHPDLGVILGIGARRPPHIKHATDGYDAVRFPIELGRIFRVLSAPSVVTFVIGLITLDPAYTKTDSSVVVCTSKPSAVSKSSVLMPVVSPGDRPVIAAGSKLLQCRPVELHICYDRTGRIRSGLSLYSNASEKENQGVDCPESCSHHSLSSVTATCPLWHPVNTRGIRPIRT